MLTERTREVKNWADWPITHANPKTSLDQLRARLYISRVAKEDYD